MEKSMPALPWQRIIVKSEICSCRRTTRKIWQGGSKLLYGILNKLSILHYNQTLPKLAYTYYRNKITTITRLSKQTYYANYFLVNINNMKKTWQAIHKLLTNCKRKFHSINSLKDPRDNNLVTHKPSRIPNILNENFATIGKS